PIAEVFDFQSVSLDPSSTRFSITCMEVEPVAARDQCQGHVEIGSQFIRSPRSPSIIARDGQPTPDRLGQSLEADDVVTLPAVQRDGDTRESLEGPLDIDSPVLVTLFGQSEALLKIRFRVRHDVDSPDARRNLIDSCRTERDKEV